MSVRLFEFIYGMDDSEQKKSLNKDLSDQRREYGRYALRREALAPDPIDQFAIWYQDAEQLLDGYPNPVTLSTVDESGAPYSRVVLLKSFSADGFVFYTNYQSKKAQHISHNKSVALLFFWEQLERQIHIQGIAEQHSSKEADSYFASRPRKSQLSAWASSQSEPISSRQTLEEAYQKFEKKFENQDVPRPPNWGGYLIRPKAFEFWQGQESRLHDRFTYNNFSYTKKQSSSEIEWHIERLSP